VRVDWQCLEVQSTTFAATAGKPLQVTGGLLPRLGGPVRVAFGVSDDVRAKLLQLLRRDPLCVELLLDPGVAGLGELGWQRGAGRLGLEQLPLEPFGGAFGLLELRLQPVCLPAEVLDVSCGGVERPVSFAGVACDVEAEVTGHGSLPARLA